MVSEKQKPLRERRAELKSELDELRPVVARARRIERRLEAIDAALDTGALSEPTRRRLPEPVRRGQILMLLAEQSRTRKELAEELGVSQPRISQLVKPMMATDRVRRSVDSKLEIAPGIPRGCNKDELKQSPPLFSKAEQSQSRRRNLTRGERQEQIAKILEEEPGLRRIDIAAVLGLTQARVGQLVSGMISAGRVCEDGERRLSTTRSLNPRARHAS